MERLSKGYDLRRRRGVRLNHVVDHTSQRAVEDEQNTAVEDGILRREGCRYKLTRDVKEKRLGRRRTPRGKRTLRRIRKSTVSNKQQVTNNPAPSRKRRNRSRSSVSSRRSSYSGSSRGSSRSSKRSRRSKNEESSTSRLSRARDSLELLRERMSVRSTSTEVSDRSIPPGWSVSSLFSSLRWGRNS